jgi:uncharacterized membrane protein (UPF0182 family)
VRLRRPVLAAAAAGAALLVSGRTFAFLYTESAWYAALGAESLWREQVADTLILHFASFTSAVAFALVNFSVVRHSILSLVLPRRLGNVEFAEAVSPRQLDFAAVVLAVVVAGISATAVPSWTALVLVRSGARFNELDPYHQLDMGFWMTWLPLEMQLHRWAWVVVLVTTVVVAALYALTPGLRWQDGMVRMTSYVRRHLSVLIGVILLMLAWRARLTSFTLLFEGSGPAAEFSRVDHRWLMPGNVILVIGTIGAAAAFLWGAWSRHVSVSFVALTGVLVLWAGINYLLPLIGRTPGAAAAAEQPYVETREAFTRRAFDIPDGQRPGERELPGGDLTRSPQVVRLAAMAHVAPGARGYLVVSGEAGEASPALGSGTSRLAHAWEERDGGLLSRELPARPSILRFRDVSARVARLAPGFALGTRPVAMFRADSIYWVIDLYTASNTYPLSRRYNIAGEVRGYFRHAATAYVQGTSGATTIVLDRGADPLAHAWQRRFPRMVRTAGGAPSWLEELSLEPTIPVPATTEVDAAFRERVRQLYVRMRAALSAADLTGFAEWFDSLGALLRGRETPPPE